nr:hypothetical protein [Agaribacterium haliotis]
MARTWRNGRLSCLSVNDYATMAAELIRKSPGDIVMHRISAYARRPTLLAPEWIANKWLAPNLVLEKLKQRGAQGSLTEKPFKAAL